MQTPSITQPGDAGAAAVELSPEQMAALVEAKLRMDEERADRLDALGNALKKKRTEAINARAALGIDEQWREDLEYYEGIDEANRHEMTGASAAWHTKPPGQAFPQQPGEVKSTVFVNITRPYCDAASARIGDMLMPTDDRAFSIEPTPIPELADIAQGKLSQSVKVGMLNQAQSEAQLGQIVHNAIEQAQAVMAQAKERAKKSQERIDDWLIECQYKAEVRKVIEDASKIGTGVLKGPIPVKRRQQQVANNAGMMEIAIKEEIKPASLRIDPRNFFPDPACGENIHNGSFVWERDYLSRKKVEELKGSPGYLDAQIDLCLDDGPQPAELEAPQLQEGARRPDSKDLFEVWYYTGRVSKEDVEAADCECEEGQQAIDAVVTMINSRVVKAARNHLDTGEFPYDVMRCQSVSGRWAGIGVSRQIRTPQRMVNAGTRNMMDNAGLSSGPQIVIRVGVVTPADGNMNLYGRKIWYASADADPNDLNNVFRAFNIDSKQAELMSIIQFGFKVAEDVTGLPLLMQGQQGKAPDTLGGMQLLNNNASTVLRRLSKNFDNYITEPHIRRYYVWLMQYGEEAEKSDAQINVHASSALVERDLQNQAVLQMGNIVLNPAFGVDPKKWFAEYCKSQRLDPKTFQYTEEEQKKLEQNASQGPSDPRLAVAQLRAQVDTALADKANQFKGQILLLEQQFEAAQNERDRQLDLIIAQMEQSGQQTISLTDLKGKLADTAIKVRAQRDLSATRAAPKLVSPPTEPAGRAPPGQAFQR